MDNNSFVKRYREGHEDMIATLDQLPQADISDLEETFKLTTNGDES
jgi:hypothetical protein